MLWLVAIHPNKRGDVGSGFYRYQDVYKRQEWDNAADSLEGTSMVSNNDIREMVPFNQLRNSRADDGLSLIHI